LSFGGGAGGAPTLLLQYLLLLLLLLLLKHILSNKSILFMKSSLHATLATMRG
jgi:hypothetical protein